MTSEIMKQTNLSQNTGSVCFWSWNDNINKEEIREQMEDFAAGRFSGVIVHSRCGLRIPYMGDEWFELYGVVIEEAKRLNLEIWIYDEDGWPSGFSGGNVTARGEKFWIKGLHFLKDSANIDKNIVAAFRKQGADYHRISADESTVGDLICCYTADSNYVDLLSKETVKVFIETTYEQYKKHFGSYFGTVIKGFFTDEPQIRTFPWSKSLADAWQKKYGSDLRDGLYMLIEETGNWQEFRYRYRSLANELFFQSFTMQLSDWCEENGLMLTGHFSSEDGLFAQMCTSGGIMRHYSAMQWPGIDCLGRRLASPVLPKQVSSIANQFGKGGTLCEVFGCAGWDISFDELIYYWGRLSVLGITKPCFHLAAYSIVGRRKRDYPAFFSYQEPWWQQFPEVMKYIDGLNRLMTEGIRDVNTLIIAPTDSIAANYLNDYEKSSYSVNMSCEYRMLLENLLDLQLDCELGDETVIASHGFVRDGAFCIGNSSYQQVFVSETSTLRESTVKLLSLFAEAGGTVIYVTEKPKLIDLKPGVMPSGIIVQNRKALLEKLVRHLKITRSAMIYDLGSDHLKPGAILHTRKLEHGKRIHIWSGADFKPGQSIVSVPIETPENYCAYLIDPVDGKRRCLKTVQSENMLLIYINLPCCGNTIIEIRECMDVPADALVTVGVKPITDCRIGLCDENALTVDYAQFSIDGHPYTEEQPIVRMIDWLYQELKKYSIQTAVPIRMKYKIYCDEALDMTGISLVVEDEQLYSIEVNEKSLSQKREGYWIDKGFGRYKIGHLMKPGINQIVLTYRAMGSECDTSILDGFENERNRFYYPFEPDSIYILGAFDVKEESEVTHYNGCYSVHKNDFRLVPPQPKKFGSITEQGAWFYRGNITYSFAVQTEKNQERVYLKLKNTRAIAAKLCVDGHCKTVVRLAENIDITDCLHEGTNWVEVTLLGHNRNLLGPHHHVKRITAMVGPSTFTGHAGFEDFVSPDITEENTWIDSYSFVPFGCDGISLIFKKDFSSHVNAVF